MPESMFGRPSQHLLPSHPSSQPVTPVSHTSRFEDVHFRVIGKPPELLSRISAPQPDHTDYHSPTPSPSSTPPPPLANNSVSQPQSSRPTLLQQLSTMDAPSQSNSSLASRIQMDVNPSGAANGTVIGSPSRSQSSSGNNALIPPVEVLPQALDSSAPPTPASSAPALEQAAVHDTMSSIPLMTLMSTRTVQFPAPSAVPSNTVASNSTEPFPSFAVVDAIMRDLPPPPSDAVPIDSLVARQQRLQAISTNLAKLTPPLPLPSSHSSSPDLSSVARVNENTTPKQPSDPQHISNSIVLRHPYPANQSSGRLELSINDPLLDASSSLTPVPSAVTLTQEYDTHRRTLVETCEILKSTLDAVHWAQTDNEHALAQRIRTFEEQRAGFEKRRQVQVARLQRESQELQEKREELNAKEAFLASLEKESRAREDARKAMLARRQAQEEDKRATDAKRNQEVQEQIAAAIKELKEIESLKAHWQDQLGESVETSDDLPTEPQDDMNDDEKRIIISRNELLGAINQIRHRLTGGVQILEGYNRTLRVLEVERKRREIEETERRRIAEEGRLRAHAEAERARQVQDENWRQLEAERKRREVESDRGQARLLHEQQAHAEAQACRLGQTSNQTSKHRSHLEDGGTSQQQATTDMTRIRAARDASSLSQEVAKAMQVDEDGTTSASHRAVSVAEARLGSGRSQSASSSKGKKPTSGGVTSTTSTPKAPTHLPPKPSGKLPSFSSSDQIGKDSPIFANASLAVSVPTEGGNQPSFPAQLASEFNRALSADIRQTPDHRTPFPRTPKPKIILDGNHGGNQELNIGPAPGVSPTQQNVNLRHLKRSRGRVDESDCGDRSVRITNGKNEEIAHPHVKEEEHDVTPKLVRTNPLASLPPRPTVIPPPRLRKPKSLDSAPESPSYPPKNNEPSLKREEESVVIGRQAPPQRSSGSQAMNTPAQLPVPVEIQNSLLLGPVHLEGHFTEPRPNAGERLTQGRSQSHVTPSSIPATAAAASSHRLDGEDPSRTNKLSSDDHREAPSGSSSQRLSDYRSPPPHISRPAIASPAQPQRLVESARQPNTSGGSRVEPMRVPSPVVGKKRPSENDDNEHGPRARRQRGDHWVASDYDYGRGDSYCPHWDRRNDSDEERRAPHRVPLAPPPDHIRPYPTTHDNRTYTSPSPEGLAAAPSSRWEQSSRRSDNDGIYQRYLPPGDTYKTATDQHRTDDIRGGQTYEPMPEGRTDDPSLLARITSSQHHPPSTNYRGRGRGDLGRGRGWSTGRGGTPLLDRITSGPLNPTLEDRLA